MRIARPVTKVLLSMLIFGALVVAAAPVGSIAATGGVQYDQLTRFGLPGYPTPLPDNFAANFKTASDNAVGFNNRPQGHGMFSVIANAAKLAKATQDMFKSGVPMTYYYLNDWERQDDPGKQTATIYRPDRKQIIHLDLAKKTYTIEDLGDQTPMPESAQPPQQPNQPPSSPEPGTAKQDITISSSLIGPKTIDGVATTGYTSDFKVVTTQATGSCQNGTYEASIDDYVSTIVPPNASTSDWLKHAMTISPSAYASQGGCTPTITMHKAVGATAPPGRLSLWEVITFKGGQQQQSQNMQSFSTYVERGNVKILGPGDAALFDVPPGFTKG
ncbi:MAG TPA: hypothetical protein VEV38_13725 [Candidatus Eremiobacteraceae bacterium]|nr:hypothetical protein [Candidatus Eremiobacteraceae bacterium]